MYFQKKQMQEASILYYEKKLTQQEIAKLMNLSRQTVSKLLNEAVRENIVEIKIHNPQINRTELEQAICEKFKIKNTVVCTASAENEELCFMATVRGAVEYLLPVVKKGSLKIGISWGKTVRSVIDELEKTPTEKNIVFPLFGATDREEAHYSSNELARSFADKIGAEVKYAWFPYKPDSLEDCELFKKTSYYKKLCNMWNDIDIAVVGIGSDETIHTFGQIFGYNERCVVGVGDIATHFFDRNGVFLELYGNTLCASENSLKNAKETIAVACGKNKTEAIAGALRTGLIDTLITDEYTAKRILTATGEIKA